MDIFNADKLESLLVANWTHFINSSKLMAYVLKNVQENANCLDIISSEKIKNKGIRVTLSRFHLNKNGFLIWVEFNTPVANSKYAEGTMELNLSFGGTLNFITMNGNLI